MSVTEPDIRAALRLIVITDRGLASPGSVEEVVELTLRAGARAIQLRDKGASASELLAQAQRLRTLTRDYAALLFVNDRVDVALSAGADGVHLGPDDLPVAAVRRVTPAAFLIGFSTDDPAEARRAVQDGASYIGCGTVYPTGSKSDAGEVIGLGRLDEVARSVPVPVIGIGGIDAARAAEV
ncbi:MAG: thiamine phosphate synthase, partial [Gemmatimonadetes bacterium]|nr:thiamine phosphate synthase [Gemmatimonadota bacterium]